jgi:hypothetical protein
LSSRARISSNVARVERERRENGSRSAQDSQNSYLLVRRLWGAIG